MVRIDSRLAQRGSAGPASARHHAQLISSAKRSHKVVMEEVTQQKKNLITVESHSLEPPKGYIFVAAGDPELTAQCKEFSRLNGSTVYVVSTSGPRGNEISQQVHRVGYHFPSDIVHRACVMLDIDLDTLEDLLRRHEEWPEEKPKPRRGNLRSSKRLKKSASGKKMLDVSKMSQADLDLQAKSAILDMFPAIPKDNLLEVIDHAFEIGSDRVGVQVSDLSLPRRAQLAVVAHIRHAYTDYDELLKEMSWADARRKVAPNTLERLATWRGDKDDEPDKMEDILREVVIISDDEDDDMDTDEPEATAVRLQTDRGVPEIDQRARSPRYKEYPQNSTTAPLPRLEQQKLIDYAPYAYPVVHDPRRRERYQVWEQARGRLRLAGRPSHPPEAPLGLYDGLSSHSPLKQNFEASHTFSSQRMAQHPAADTYALNSDHRGYAEETRPYRSYDHSRKEADPYTHQVSNPPAYQILSQPSSRRPTSGDQIHYFMPATHNRGRADIKPIVPSPPRQVSYAHTSTQKSVREDVSSAKWESEVIFPSIESPRAPKPSDHRFARGNDHAIVIDSSPTDKQVYRELRSIPDPGAHPEQLNSKRRRLESPRGRPNASGNVIAEPITSNHRTSGVAPPMSIATGETRERGKIVYLPVRENGNSSTFSQSANFSASQNALQGNAPTRQHNLPTNIPTNIPIDVQTVVDSQPGYFREESPRFEYFTNQPLLRSRTPPKTDPRRRLQLVGASAHEDLSRRQIYMVEQPLAASTTAKKSFRVYEPRAPPSISSRPMQAQELVHSNEKLQRRDTVIDHSAGDGTRMPMRQVSNRRTLPGETPERNRQQYVDSAPYSSARQSDINNLHNGEGHGYHQSTRGRAEYIPTGARGAYFMNSTHSSQPEAGYFVEAARPTVQGTGHRYVEQSHDHSSYKRDNNLVILD